jgi:hypothetical protein
MNGIFMSCREHALSLLEWKLVVLILLVSGCGYAPNLIPGGEKLLTQPGIRALASSTDYAIVLTVKRGQEQVDVHWVKKGGMVWGERPGNIAVQWRFVMSKPGLEGDPLCVTDWETDSGDSSKKVTDVVCKFKVDDYLGTALLGEVLFRLDGDPTGEDSYRSVARTYYLVDK